jgi:hypothetical protein
MKQLYISHGDKGGVGKSILAAIVAESILGNNNQIGLIEGDTAQPDLALRYDNDLDVLLGVLPLNRAGDASQAVSKFATWLERSDPAHVVINLPAGASETLDEHGDLIRQVGDALGYSLTCFYSLGKGDTPTAGLVKSLQSGLMSHIETTRQIVVYPAFQGDPHDFVWYGHAARKSFQGREIIMPALPSRSAFKKLLSTPGRIAGLAARGANDWMVVDRLNVARWLKSALAAVEPILIEV